jgi:IS5 family transposase
MRTGPTTAQPAANVADSTVLPDPLHGNETRVWRDQAYRGQRAVIRRHAPRAQDFVNHRYRHRVVVDKVERAKNRTNSKVRARVEHSIGLSPNRGRGQGAQEARRPAFAKTEFATDSPLEGDGFELPVRERGQSGCRPKPRRRAEQPS